ncbi:uncharacterized protein DNG_04195 [Cephalotrichum gorgonifer]|uniref:Uncharacterized protein n=1 Tax=Cephalotrichum gorgonifer TaxID=2041049 RepID=A0AAE8MY34_9PEZI|nr:uncharacterized protein DNG_04195 [Cephalotrichum gorgonifer]
MPHAKIPPTQLMQETHSYPPSPTGGFPSQSSDGGMSVGNDVPAGTTTTTRTSSQCSSQESQLLHLSTIASMQEKLDDGDAAGLSRKRMADGQMKDVPRAHSRSTSTVSMASTSGGRMGEVLTSELKTRLSYAMVKVNHGWQGHSIDEVESLASQAASPTSSSSTIPRRLSASPALSQGLLKSATNHNGTPPASHWQLQSPYDPTWTDSSRGSPTQGNGTKPRNALAPPAPIQPGQPLPRSYDGRPSKPGYTPTLLSHSHTHVSSPHTPTVYTYSNSQPTPRGDPIIFSPHQNVRDQDAIEALISMSSPGGNGLSRHTFSPSSPHHSHNLPPTSSAPPRTGGRHALPTGQPRKSLPSGRPAKVDTDSVPGSPLDEQQRTPRRRMNGNIAPLRSSLSMPAALGSSLGRRLRDEEIERMLDRAAEEESEDDGEILIPRRLGGVVGTL